MLYASGTVFRRSSRFAVSWSFIYHIIYQALMDFFPVGYAIVWLWCEPWIFISYIYNILYSAWLSTQNHLHQVLSSKLAYDLLSLPHSYKHTLVNFGSKLIRPLVCIWIVLGNLRTQRKPTQTWAEHISSMQILSLMTPELRPARQECWPLEHFFFDGQPDKPRGERQASRVRDVFKIGGTFWKSPRTMQVLPLLPEK